MFTFKQILNGKQEANAFDNKQFIELHQSTLRKVNCISDILYRVLDNSLITDSKFLDRYGLHPKMIYYYFYENWIFGLIMFFIGTTASMITIFK